MPNEPNKRVSVAVVLLLAVPVLYVLSIGPFWWFHSRQSDIDYFVGLERFETYYAPIDWCCRKSEVATGLYNTYVNMWLPPHQTMYRNYIPE